MDEYITTRRGEQYELSDLVNFHLHSARAHSESVRSSRSRASAFGDARLGKSYSAIISGMVANKSCSVPQLSGSDAALSRRAYRFVHHDQVGPSELMAHSTRINVSDWAGEELLLVLEDITQLNLSLHRSPARESWKQTMGGLSDGTVGIHLLAGLMMRTPEAVKKMVILAAKAAEQAMQLVQAFQEQGPQLTPVQTLFDAEDERTLDLMDRKLAARGKSATNHNPHPVGSLKRAAWTIARHGGWLGYEKSAKPRPATMLRGLEKMRYLRRFVEHLDPDDS